MEEIRTLIDNFDGKIYDVCYEILKKYGETAEIFEYVCKNFLGLPEKAEISVDQYFTETEIEQYTSAYGDTVNGLLNSCIKKCNLGLLEPQNFYASLWNTFCTNFSTTKERAFALYYTVIGAAVPYQFLGKPISMSNERFREILKKNEVSIKKILYIKQSRYIQRTEEASLLLNCIEEIEDYESKVVVLAQGISLLHKESGLKRIIESLLKKQYDEESEPHKSGDDE